MLFEGKEHLFPYHFANPAEYGVYNLLPNGVVTAGIVVGSILLAADELLRVEEPMVGPSPDLIYREEQSWRATHSYRSWILVWQSKTGNKSPRSPREVSYCSYDVQFVLLLVAGGWKHGLHRLPYSTPQRRQGASSADFSTGSIPTS